MAKFVLLVAFLFYFPASYAQIKVDPTDKFSIEQKGKTQTFFDLEQSDSFSKKNIGDVTMISSKGEEKPERKNVKAILLKAVLAKIILDAGRQKDLNLYYFLLEATDGYKVVLSYNEVFNTENIYIITESNGQSIKHSQARIEVLALSEKGKGHIYVKGLKRLTVHKWSE